VTPEQECRFADDLLAWYRKARRPLPWRRTRDPYRIWISEILLQQTRVETATAYYQSFIERFPSLQTLAEADMESVLQVWQGLGYYGRARNLQRAARTVLEQFNGKIPREPASLMELPGIGPYTAAAVASIAFNRDVFTIDGNVKRVLSRLYAIRRDPELPAVRKRQEAIGKRFLPQGKARNFNQAMMELGALVCKPGRPLCADCPVSSSCSALEKGLTDRLPVRSPKPAIPVRKRAVAAIRNRGASLFFVRRPPEGLLGGLWEFPGLDLKSRESGKRGLGRLLLSLENRIRVEAVSAGRPFSVQHSYSHFQEQIYVYRCQGKNGKGGRGKNPTGRWIHPRNIENIPITGATRKILRGLELKQPPV
jgi:A/G-specific adenine glycosylase